jgi:hypothetical protein
VHEKDALNTANANKFQSKKELPRPADIQKLREYCKKIFQENYSSLTNIGFDFMKWKRLGQVLLCQIWFSIEEDEVKFLVLYWTIIRAKRR